MITDSVDHNVMDLIVELCYDIQELLPIIINPANRKTNVTISRSKNPYRIAHRTSNQAALAAV